MSASVTRFLAALVMLTSPFAAPARAAVMAGPGLIDQEHLAGREGDTRHAHAVDEKFSWAQTFTVGRAGLLDRVEVQVWRDPAPELPGESLVVQVRRTHRDGAPDASDAGLLATLSIPGSEITRAQRTGAFTGADLGARSIPVEVGDQLAIVIAASGAPAGWWYMWGSTNTRDDGADVDYLRGSAYEHLSGPVVYTPDPWVDHGFRTFVTVPEPAALVPVGAAGAVLLLGRRGRVKA